MLIEEFISIDDFNCTLGNFEDRLKKIDMMNKRVKKAEFKEIKYSGPTGK